MTVLFYFDDLKSQDIAAILRILLHSTVRTRLNKARKHLRDVLGDYEDTSTTRPEWRRITMQLNFSACRKTCARYPIAVPEVRMDMIRRRSHTVARHAGAFRHLRHAPR